MIRKREALASEERQLEAQRDRVVHYMNAVLDKKEVRQGLRILPKETFGRLIEFNTARMHWRDPENVFKAAEVKAVALNTARLEEALEDTLLLKEAAAMRALFLNAVQFVPWKDFLNTFGAVVFETVERLKQLRKTAPRRLTLLMLNTEEPNKSNAWLVGFAWAALRQVVDFVVSDNEAVSSFLGATSPAAIFYAALRDLKLVPTTVEAMGAAEGNDLTDFLTNFEIDIIYVDDMVYSGTQAALALFHDRNHDNLAASDDKNRVSPGFASRIHVHLIIAYIAQRGYNRLTGEALGYGQFSPIRVHMPKSIVHVPSYESVIADAVQRLRANPWFSAKHWLWGLIDEVGHIRLPAIVFEHKLADEVSLPLWLIKDRPFAAEREFEMEPKRAEKPAYAAVLGKIPNFVLDSTPFYKTKAFQWWLPSNGFALQHFTDMDVLFRALQAHCPRW